MRSTQNPSPERVRAHLRDKTPDLAKLYERGDTLVVAARPGVDPSGGIVTPVCICCGGPAHATGAH